jgi:biopolymer transport protein ExbB/TolQ
MLGLVATMIPMGPALKALGEGQLADVSRSLMVAFSAVILALIAAAITYWVVNVRRRWYAHDLAVIEKAASAPRDEGQGWPAPARRAAETAR